MNSARQATVAKIARISRSGPIAPMTVDRSRKERKVAATLIEAVIIRMPRPCAPTARHLTQYVERSIGIVFTDGMHGDIRPALRSFGTRFANSVVKKLRSNEVTGATASLFLIARIGDLGTK